MNRRWAALGVVLVLALAVQAEDKVAPDDLKPDTADPNLGAGKQGSRYAYAYYRIMYNYFLINRTNFHSFCVFLLLI